MHRNSLLNTTFQKENRLLKSSEYNAVFSHGERISIKEIVFIVKKNKNSLPKLGLIIRKKVAKKAVTRNLIKRIIRESFRLNKKLLDGLDIVVMPLNGITTIDKTDLRKILDNQWKTLQKKFIEA